MSNQFQSVTTGLCPEVRLPGETDCNLQMEDEIHRIYLGKVQLLLFKAFKWLLNSHGIVSFTEVTSCCSGSIKTQLQRGRIKNMYQIQI